jgi:CHASE2 domain-containing sensor protein/tRNA A-37 threonylcarbamoyl transferase component Bud32
MLGTVLGERYRIIDVLGVGGFGKTYLAEDTHPSYNSRRCVVKQFKPATQDARSLEIARRLFNKEVEVLKRLGQHDQIPTFIDFFEENQEFYLVQELIEGQPLSEEFAQRKLTEKEVLEFLQDALSVLEFIHKSQVIHRDIKPGNLIRRKRDGKIVIIDFGAVKEINTQLASGSGQSSFTVGIGTQGYTPSEQLAGKPRFCSDIYALGMTAIQSLTGLQPAQLPEDPDTSEYLWQDYADISLGLRFVLNRMVRFHHSQRYLTASDALRALHQVANLPTNLTEIPISSLLPEGLVGSETQPELLNLERTDWRSQIRAGARVVAIATIAVTSVVLGLRQLGWLESLELGVYDRMTQLRPQLPPDPRLLIVTIGEADLQALNRPTPSDKDVAQVIANLMKHSPRAIGLDLYRDLPQEPGQQELLRQLQSPEAIAIMNLGSNNSPPIDPPPGVSLDRVGFNDFPIDPDSAVRRALLFGSLGSETYYSFSLRLALKYLASQDIKPSENEGYPNLMQLENTVFHPLESDAGGYNNADTAGYQILLDYRTDGAVAPQISFVDVLKGTIDPQLVKDRIILIGTTAPSGKDLFNTPYTTGQREDYQMPGVVVHAQMVSQILDATLNYRPLFRFWSEWAEILWIAGWTTAGGVVAWFVRHPLRLGVSSMLLLLVLSGTSFIIFLQSFWVPVIAPAIATIIAGGSIIVYRAYRLQLQQRVLTQLWWDDNPSRNFHHKE